ncbi:MULTISPECIES: class C beta-lactamase [Paraburkholderia]|uniref:class C beta-lactamase n=1 Tax=Paraburkholderia TaxID=1822464 RepID=UPI002258748A|nr:MULTISPECIES: class C beta-lactamase [Paraburkholderia]MCX4163087.1 beta-lactamase [Paraburkholderia megapolitana]MDN7158583.1 beta-lactamase [Paraburkholderia sp. CHISQ3]MDQ6495630.1 beta-lactamase [Paraburkholderia megapolitana]
MKLTVIRLMVTIAVTLCATTSISHAAGNQQDQIRQAVDEAVRPVMAKNNIAGMAIGIIDGQQHYVYSYGVASLDTRKPVTQNTLFELGSISKTFTAALTSLAQVDGELALTDKVGKYLPLLSGSRFADARVLDLGTHTPGGLPLQVPDNVSNNDQLMQYLKAWQPAYAPGTERTYSNISIGMLGVLTATSMKQGFAALVEQRLFAALGMTNSYFDVPQAHMADYAQGYKEDGTPIRVAPGVLSTEAYGIKTSAADMTRFLQANMNQLKLDEKLQRAITQTHTGYFKAGVMTQDLIWEQYAYPVALKTLQEGNSPAMIFNVTPVTEFKPPQAPREDVWINKTGSTNGFGAYVAFIPEKQLGIVILANRSFPIDERVSTAYRILTAIAGDEH